MKVLNILKMKDDWSTEQTQDKKIQERYNNLKISKVKDW